MVLRFWSLKRYQKGIFIFLIISAMLSASALWSYISNSSSDILLTYDDVEFLNTTRPHNLTEDELTTILNGYKANIPESESSLPQCPSVDANRNLKGILNTAKMEFTDDLQEDVVVEAHNEILPGGHWKPKDCQARGKVAIIIPYRDRHSHLVNFLNFIFPMLQRQLLDFRIIVTEQHGNDLFNKGRIMNAAFLLAEKLEVDCVIFHDVDMFPEDDRISYECPNRFRPKHLGAYVNSLGYSLWYKELVGGVLALDMNDYRDLNGFSNLYWGWGGEDDDMGKRILTSNYTIERLDKNMARYMMLKHKKRYRESSKLVRQYLRTAQIRMNRDGLNNTKMWSIIGLEVKPLYFHLMVDVHAAPIEWKQK